MHATIDEEDSPHKVTKSELRWQRRTQGWSLDQSMCVCVCVLVLRFQGAVFQLRDTNR